MSNERIELPDPKDQPPERLRAIRDEIREAVERLIAARGWRADRPNRSASRLIAEPSGSTRAPNHQLHQTGHAIDGSRLRIPPR